MRIKGSPDRSIFVLRRMFCPSERRPDRQGKEICPRTHRPDVILREGTGPQAVAAIQGEMGPLPVIFITAPPDDCARCDPPTIILGKPVVNWTVQHAFRTVAPF